MLKNFLAPAGKKSLSMRGLSLLSLLGNPGTENARIDIDHYVQSSPVFTATKMIADAISGIDIIIKDKKSDKVIYDHDALKLLENPNPFTTGNLLLKELASFYILTGNTYLKSIGNPAPIELSVLNPSGITITAGNDGYPGSYEYQTQGIDKSQKFSRDSQNGQKVFSDSMRNQIAQLRDFNPRYSSTQLVGVSTFAGCVYEVVLGIMANIHNYSLLKNQGRPSGLLTYSGTEELSDDQINDVLDIIKNKMSGAENAGKTTFLAGNFDWKQMSESIKDMDFPTLKKTVAEAIFKAAKIPLAMVSPDNMSFANMDASKFAFYDNAVLPIFKEILDFLTLRVLRRFNGTENLIFTYDESAIESLQLRKLDYATKLYTSGLGSRKEGRAQIGYEDVDNGEDIFFQRSQFNITDANSSQGGTKAIEKAEYVRLMTSMTDLKGKRMHSDDVIQRNLLTFYGK